MNIIAMGIDRIISIYAPLLSAGPLVPDRSLWGLHICAHFSNNNNAVKHFKDWKELVERETRKRVKILRTDNGGEYTSKSFEEYQWCEGINHQVTAPYTSAQNGKAERLHRTLFNRA